MEDFSSKTLYRTMAGLAAKVDEQRKTFQSVRELFACNEYEQNRRKLVETCKQLMLNDFDKMGLKGRYILWHKGFYVSINVCRKLGDDETEKQQVKEFIDCGIRELKSIVMLFDREFNLELADTMDMSIVKDERIKLEHEVKAKPHVINDVPYAFEIVYLTLIAIGDLCRYALQLKFNDLVKDKEAVARYYREALKLNDRKGLAHNQLGLLFAGENYDIDSTFHYLFSMACKEPFELSVMNVERIFRRNQTFIEESDDSDSVKCFLARFLLIVDIFYYDKDVSNLCDLCQGFLIDLKVFIETDEEFFTEDVLFKISAILLLCLEQLVKTESKKVAAMNAVLVALIAEYVDCFNNKFDRFKSTREAQNLVFNGKYNRIYAEFEEFVRREKAKPKIVERKDTPESGSSNKENSSLPASQTASSGKEKRRRNRRRRAISTSSTESEDEDLNDEKFHFTDSSESDDGLDSFDSDSDADDIFDNLSDSGDEIVILEEEIIPPEPAAWPMPIHELVTSFEKFGVHFRKAYNKIDPNIVIEFCQQEKTLKSLKILFNWLDTAHDVLTSCYGTNPEFVHKIMRLVNALNIDIFTHKFFFDRSFVCQPEIRKDLGTLNDTRHSIPVDEDVELKAFSILRTAHTKLDWEIRAKLAITTNENAFLRMMKIVDFGFTLSKMRKFSYFFCGKERIFIERKKRNDEMIKQKPRKRERRQRGDRGERKEYLRNQEKNNRRNSNRNVEEMKIIERPLKGKTTGEKMGELWLRSEVKLLEKKVDNNMNGHMDMAPYIILDTKALVDYTSIVKALVRTKKFIILVPTAVLGEMDELKKNSESVRNIIKWLEREFYKGNRFIRSQRKDETLPITLLKIPKKLDHDADIFFKIVSFCNYMVSKNVEMITLLTGESYTNRCCDNFSCCGILGAIPIKFEQISSFFGKYKNKK